MAGNPFKNLSFYLSVIVMYHPGRVVEVFSHKDKNVDSIDASTQAMLEMWDENLITVLVEPQLDGKLKKDSVVLVDYRPSDKGVPKMTVIKLLKGESAKATWAKYKDHYKKRSAPQTPLPMKATHEVKQPYVG